MGGVSTCSSVRVNPWLRAKKTNMPESQTAVRSKKQRNLLAGLALCELKRNSQQRQCLAAARQLDQAANARTGPDKGCT